MVSVLWKPCQYPTPDSHAKTIQVRTYLDVFFPCNIARSWRGLPWFIVPHHGYQASFLWELTIFSYELH